MLKMPRFIEEGWEYLDKESETFKLKSNAPEWAIKEAEEYYRKIKEAEENGINL